MSPLVNPASLFRFRFSCRRRESLWPPAAANLDASCRLPSLAAVVGVPDVLELALGWNETGLAVRAVARGVGATRWCQPTRAEDSDGLHLWIATRPTGDSHRAGRFCRRLALLPTGGGPRADQPVAVSAAIPRTSELPANLPEGAITLASRLDADGWQLDARIGSAALPGWDPAEIPRLGFLAAVVDRRLGRIPCCAPPEYPWDSDPTTWATLDLVA
jgi:hypothetical protein